MARFQRVGGSTGRDRRRSSARTRVSRDRAATALSLGFVTTFLSSWSRCRSPRSSGRRRARGHFGMRSRARRPCGAEAHARDVVCRDALNGVLGTITAWVLVRDDFRGKTVATRSSTCRSPCRRSSPASRCWRSTGRPRRSGSTSRSRGLDRARDDVRDAAVRRPDGSARAAGARPGGRAGRALARRLARAHVLPRDLPEPAPGSSPASRSRSRRRSASSVARDHHGNVPFETEVSSVYIYGRIESGDSAAAAAVAVVLLAISFATLLVIGVVRTSRRGTTVTRLLSRLGLRSSRSPTSRSSSSGRSRSSSGAPSRTASARPGTRSRRPRRSTPSSSR